MNDEREFPSHEQRAALRLVGDVFDAIGAAVLTIILLPAAAILLTIVVVLVQS